MQVIAETRNTVNETKNATRHAEINAVDVVEALGQTEHLYGSWITLTYLLLPDSRDTLARLQALRILSDPDPEIFSRSGFNPDSVKLLQKKYGTVKVSNTGRVINFKVILKIVRKGFYEFFSS